VARVERRFSPARQEVKTLLSGLLNDAYRDAGQAIQEADAEFAKAQNCVSNSPLPGNFGDQVKGIATLLATAKGDLASKDYVRLLKARKDATCAETLSHTLADTASGESVSFSQEKKRREGQAVLEALKMLGITIILCLVLAIVFSIGGCVAGIFAQGENSTGRYANGGSIVGLVLGIVIGVLWGIRNVLYALDGKDPW
jgi:hypothetical protein